MLLVVITIAALQLSITLMHPTPSTFVYGSSAVLHEINPGYTTINITQVETQVVTQPTTQTQTIITTAAPQTITSNVTIAPQAIPPDYTPIGIAIVVVIGILVLLVMFLRRRG